MIDRTIGELLVLSLLRAQVAASLAILAVLALRGPVRRLAGARVAYRLWVLVPAAGVSSLFPTLSEFLRRDGLFGAGRASGGGAWVRALTDDGFWGASAQGLVIAWLAGAAGLALLFLWAEARFRRLARLGLAGPAIVGVASPRLVVPWDYAQRFTETERAFIRRHERAHMARGDTLANLLIAVVRALGWFNPLIHVAAGVVRLDQEAACDAQVLEGRPRDRRPYAEALLKAHLPVGWSGLACPWSPVRRHPLEQRLRLLTRPEPSLRRYVVGVALVGLLGGLAAASVWALAPPRQDAEATASPTPTVMVVLGRTSG